MRFPYALILAGAALAVMLAGAIARADDKMYEPNRESLDQRPLPQSFTVRLRDPQLSINVMAVWRKAIDDYMVCGAVLSTGNSAAVNGWVSLVDRLD